MVLSKPWAQKDANYICFASINSVNKKDSWMGKSRMYIGGKKLCFILCDYNSKGRELSVIWINFSMKYGLYPLPFCLWHTKKVIIYTWIAHRWIVYRELAQPPSGMFWFMEGIERLLFIQCTRVFQIVSTIFLFYSMF